MVHDAIDTLALLISIKAGFLLRGWVMTWYTSILSGLVCKRNDQPFWLKLHPAQAGRECELAGWGSWDTQDQLSPPGAANYQKKLTARLLQVKIVFLAYHMEIHSLQLQIPAINKIPANWANTSSKSFPHNKWNNETSGNKCKKPFVINEKMVIMLPNC